MKGYSGQGFGYPQQVLVDLGREVASSATLMWKKRKQKKSLKAANLQFAARVTSAADVLEKRFYTKETVDAYMRCASRFCQWRIDTAAVGTEMDVGRYLDSLYNSEVNRATVRLCTSALRTVLDRVLDLDATTGISYPAPPPERPPVPEEIMLRLVAATQSNDERLLLFLLNVLDLRPGLINNLKQENFLLKQRLVILTDRKGRLKKMKLSTEQVRQLTPLLEVKHKSGFLFPSPQKKGRSVTVRCLQQRLERIADRAGVHVTCTSVRRACSSAMQQHLKEIFRRRPAAGSCDNAGNSQQATSHRCHSQVDDSSPPPDSFSNLLC